MNIVILTGVDGTTTAAIRQDGRTPQEVIAIAEQEITSVWGSEEEFTFNKDDSGELPIITARTEDGVTLEFYMEELKVI